MVEDQPGRVAAAKSQAHDGVHREHHRDDRPGKDIHRRAQVCPFAFRAAETQCQSAVEHLTPAGRTVACHCQVWYQRQEQVHRARHQVGVDGQKVPA